MYWAGNNDIREKERERARDGGGKDRVKEKCCIPAGSLGTNGNTFIKLPHVPSSLGMWSEHTGCLTQHNGTCALDLAFISHQCHIGSART